MLALLCARSPLCSLSLCFPSPPRLPEARARPGAALPLLRPRFPCRQLEDGHCSSCDQGKGKAFCLGQENQGSEAKPNRTAPRGLQNSHRESPKSSRARPFTHGAGIKEPATIWGHKAEDRGAGWHQKSLHDNLKTCFDSLCKIRLCFMFIKSDFSPVFPDIQNITLFFINPLILVFRCSYSLLRFSGNNPLIFLRIPHTLSFPFPTLFIHICDRFFSFDSKKFQSFPVNIHTIDFTLRAPVNQKMSY